MLITWLIIQMLQVACGVYLSILGQMAIKYMLKSGIVKANVTKCHLIGKTHRPSVQNNYLTDSDLLI